jgi:hypothetical protein
MGPSFMWQILKPAICLIDFLYVCDSFLAARIDLMRYLLYFNKQVYHEAIELPGFEELSQ